MSFNIIKINEDKSVEVVFDCDNKQQNISQLPTDNQEDLEIALQNYEEAYVGGLILEGKIKEQ